MSKAKKLAVRNVSLKNEGEFVEGKYQGCRLVWNDQGLPLLIVFLKTPEEQDVSIVAGYQIQEFIENTRYKKGYDLVITRTGDITLKGNRKMGLYEIEYDEEGIAEGRDYNPTKSVTSDEIDWETLQKGLGPEK